MLLPLPGGGPDLQGGAVRGLALPGVLLIVYTRWRTGGRHSVEVGELHILYKPLLSNSILNNVQYTTYITIICIGGRVGLHQT